MAQLLLVEDNAAAAALICQYMKALYSDHQITICATATDAFDWAGKHHIDLFILDIQLPDYRGTELGKHIRAMPEYRFTPILFTTELGGEELAAYREIKCYDFLIKPFTQEQFLRAVSTALDMGQQMKKPEPILRIEQKQFLFEYELKQIRYIESFGKRLVIHSISQGEDLADQISGYSLMRLLELAGKDNLIQCHKSFLINPVFIKKIDKGAKELWLKDRIALSYLRSPQEAEDVVQTVFLKLLEGGMIVYSGKERAFLTKVTINHCKNLLTAVKKHEAIPLDEAVLLIQPEDRDIFYAVMELPEKYRAVVSLHYFEGYSFREISEFLHIGISAVSMRLHRAKNILKKQLGRD